jgi:ketohexokinase/beta-glucosidase
MTYKRLAKEAFPEWDVSEWAIRGALRSRGYNRRVARAKPPLTDVNKQARLRWAQAHVDWTPQQWESILWSDETWITGGRHRRQLVTRRPGEELDPTCIVYRIPRRRGWIFWGCFSGITKGPCLFWEKEWKTINKESYSERIVPLVHGWVRLYPGLHFMQDGAPGHSAAYTIDELHQRGIYPIFWPAYSPDLNPIESVWNRMKDYIQQYYPDQYGGRQHTYDQLRIIVQEAWDSISVEYLQDLMDSMKARCEAVIAAQGGHTQY